MLTKLVWPAVTKSISIIADHVEAGALVSGTNGIVVNVANATDIVVLRGLDIEGLGSGLNGITVLTGGSVHVEKCTINHFTQNGINFVPTQGGSQLHVLNTRLPALSYISFALTSNARRLSRS